MKRFVLIVKYGTGEVATTVETSDILQETKKFKQKLTKKLSGWGDKGCYIPEITSIKIVPLFYESIYEKGD